MYYVYLRLKKRHNLMSLISSMLELKGLQELFMSGVFFKSFIHVYCQCQNNDTSLISKLVYLEI